MRSSSVISIADVVLGLTILISTICSCALSMESEGSGLQQQDMLMGSSSASGSSSHPSFVPALNDRYFRNYYEMIHDASEPMWKRAPAAGFFGMRGKKVPSSTFYGMRGKKGPSGFLGMRGKKSQDNAIAAAIAAQLANSSPSDLTTGGLPVGPLKLKGPGGPASASSSSAGLDIYDDYSLFGAAGPSAGLISTFKRAPAEGFMGLRGKRSPVFTSVADGQPARSYK